MWGIFLESVVIFKNYMGWHENHFLAGIYLFALIYLWLTEKDKTKRAVFVYTPALILLLFFCPLFPQRSRNSRLSGDTRRDLAVSASLREDG